LGFGLVLTPGLLCCVGGFCGDRRGLIFRGLSGGFLGGFGLGGSRIGLLRPGFLGVFWLESGGTVRGVFFFICRCGFSFFGFIFWVLYLGGEGFFSFFVSVLVLSSVFFFWSF